MRLKFIMNTNFVFEQAKLSKRVELKNAETNRKAKSAADFVSCGRPWLDLQTSYAAIAATNYESLAELITTVRNTVFTLCVKYNWLLHLVYRF